MDLVSYFRKVHGCSVLAGQLGIGFARCGGFGELDALLERTRAARGVLAVSDVTEERIIYRQGTWHRRRVYTLFVLLRYDVREGGYNSELSDRLSDLPTLEEALQGMRLMVQQLLSRMLHDYLEHYADMAYLDVYDVRCRELGTSVLQGATGTAMQLAMEYPVDLSFKSEQWSGPLGELN